jgi:hypothetical protein
MTIKYPLASKCTKTKSSIAVTIKAPLMHKGLSLEDRCENAVSGFCLVDMFKLLADRRAQQRGMPVGSGWIAGPTAFNLQGVALSTMVVCVTKPDKINPWTHGHGRLTGIHIEEGFGTYRNQFTTGQFDARQFWQAEARQCRTVLQKMQDDKTEQLPEVIPHLTDEQYAGCCARGLKNAIKLAAFCEGATTDSVEKVYRQACSDREVFEAEELVDIFDVEEIEDAEDEPWRKELQKQADEICTDMVGQLQAEEVFEREGWESRAPPASDMDDLLDAELLKQVASADSNPATEPCSQAPESQGEPCTLAQAFKLKSNIFNSLLRLLIKLRCGNAGYSSAFLNNCLACRKMSKATNWYQHYESELASVNLEVGENVFRGRQRSFDGWRSLAFHACQELSKDLQPPESIETGHIVLFWARHNPDGACSMETQRCVLTVGLVLTVWKRGAKFQKPATKAVPISQCHSFRAIPLKNVVDEPTKWTCDAFSLAWNNSFESLVAVLDCSEAIHGMDCFVASLTGGSVAEVDASKDLKPWAVSQLGSHGAKSSEPAGDMDQVVQLGGRAMVRRKAIVSKFAKKSQKKGKKSAASAGPAAGSPAVLAAIEDEDAGDPTASSSGAPAAKVSARPARLVKAIASEKMVPIPANFTRHAAGRALIKSEMQVLLELDMIAFPKSPMFLPGDGPCRLKFPVMDLAWSVIHAVSPDYFVSEYHSRRKMADFGALALSMTDLCVAISGEFGVYGICIYGYMCMGHFLTYSPNIYIYICIYIYIYKCPYVYIYIYLHFRAQLKEMRFILTFRPSSHSCEDPSRSALETHLCLEGSGDRWIFIYLGRSLFVCWW